jgi:hypothetical protein
MDYADLKLELFVDKKLFIEHTATTAKHKIYRYELVQCLINTTVYTR